MTEVKREGTKERKEEKQNKNKVIVLGKKGKRKEKEEVKIMGIKEGKTISDLDLQ